MAWFTTRKFKQLASAVVLSLILPASGWAAITLDAVSNGISGPSGSLTLTHVISGSDRYLFVCIQANASGGAFGVSSATYNGSAMTHIADTFATTSLIIELWGIANPATGSHNIAITFSGTNDLNLAASVSYKGTDASGTPLGTAVTANDTTGTSNGPITVNASSAAGEIVVDCAAPYFALSVPTTAGAGQTKRSELDDTGSSGSWVGMSDEAGAGTVTMSWTLHATPRDWATIAVPLKPLSGGGGGSSFPHFMPLTGVGH